MTTQNWKIQTQTLAEATTDVNDTFFPEKTEGDIVWFSGHRFSYDSDAATWVSDPET